MKKTLKRKTLTDGELSITFERDRYLDTEKVARGNGKQVVLIDRFYPSSKTCSCCGYKKKDLKLDDRFWTCLCRGEHHDRDINASKNILIEGQRMLREV